MNESLISGHLTGLVAPFIKYATVKARGSSRFRPGIAQRWDPTQSLVPLNKLSHDTYMMRMMVLSCHGVGPSCDQSRLLEYSRVHEVQGGCVSAHLEFLIACSRESVQELRGGENEKQDAHAGCWQWQWQWHQLARPLVPRLLQELDAPPTSAASRLHIAHRPISYLPSEISIHSPLL